MAPLKAINILELPFPGVKLTVMLVVVIAEKVKPVASVLGAFASENLLFGLLVAVVTL